MNRKNLDKLITEALIIEESEAKSAGALGFMSRALIQATLPHSKPDTNQFKRVNGNFSLTMLADPEIGLPYGCIPRLVLAWISTEAVRTKDRHLILGNTLSEFMEQLDLVPSGGRWGTITRLREQMTRLLSSSISCIYDDGNNWSIRNVNLVSKADLWWEPKQPNQRALFESTLTLNLDFFEEITRNPVPIDLRALKALKSSSVALDLYCWLTYRLSYLRHKTEVPWQLLQMQFGANYADTKQGRFDFKRKLLIQLRKILVLYEGSRNIDIGENGLILRPGKPHIEKKSKL